MDKEWAEWTAEAKRRFKLYSRQWEQFAKTHPMAPDVRKVMGALMETHPSLTKMRDGPKKLAKAYELAMRTFATQDETNEMLHKAMKNPTK